MQLLVLTHPSEVQHFIAQNRIVVENLVKLAQLEEDDLVEVFFFDLPVLDH